VNNRKLIDHVKSCWELVTCHRKKFKKQIDNHRVTTNEGEVEE